MSLYPGSEMSGDPASLTNATDLPPEISSMTFAACSASLKLCRDRKSFLRLRPSRENSFLVTRVSSQATMSAFRSVSVALSEISCKLPMGVAMMYRPFFIFTYFTILVFYSIC